MVWLSSHLEEKVSPKLVRILRVGSRSQLVVVADNAETGVPVGLVGRAHDHREGLPFITSPLLQVIHKAEGHIPRIFIGPAGNLLVHKGGDIIFCRKIGVVRR